MRSLGWGALIALVVAGPSLYPLVESGTISGPTALVRWAAVAAACAVGVGLIAGVAGTYRTAEGAENPDDGDDHGDDDGDDDAQRSQRSPEADRH